MKTKTIEFTAINSGDYECFCWDVDIETFKKIKGKEPDVFDYVEINRSDIDNYKPIGDKVRLYPNDIFKSDRKIKVKIEIETLVIFCRGCDKELNPSELKSHNKDKMYDEYFCDNCLSKCSVCEELFADYDNIGKCENCAD